MSEYFLSTVIPMPAEMALEEFRSLAIFTIQDKLIIYWWWEDQRKVVIWDERHHHWLLQEDLTIGESLADVLGWSPMSVGLDSLLIYHDRNYRHGFALPDCLERLFLDCEWSDYACDHRPVSGRLFKNIPSRPSRFESSLSDDDDPVCARKFTRYHSWT